MNKINKEKNVTIYIHQSTIRVFQFFFCGEKQAQEQGTNFVFGHIILEL